MAGGMAQVMEGLPSKREALSSSPSKREREREKEGERERLK
jgi:hypothetical protein